MPRPALYTRTYLGRFLMAGFGGLLLGAAIAVSQSQAPATADEPAMLAPVADVTVIAPPVIAHQDVPPVPASQSVELVFRAGGATWIKLGNAEAPRGIKPVLADDNYITSAIAALPDARVPASARGWIGKRVVVDDTCNATVTSIAVVARLTGYPSYAGIEDSDDKWTAATAMEHGTKVLAAKLDNCAGGTYARDAAAPGSIILEEIADAPLADAALRLTKRSPEARAAQKAWAEAEQKGVWTEDEGVQVQTKVLRHPTTGQTFVSVHLFFGAVCGLPTMNAWGLYRADADGKLARVKSSIGDFITIERLVDLDGDGELEVIGAPWLGTERAVQDTDGTTLETLELPFYMCPC
jgi:hypothetical protein